MGRRTGGAADREEWAADRSGQRTNCPESGPGRKAPHLSSLSGAVAPLRTDGPGQSIAAHPAGGTHRRPRTLVLHYFYNEMEGVEWRDKRRPSGGTSDGSGGRWETRVATADGGGGGLMGEQD